MNERSGNPEELEDERVIEDNNVPALEPDEQPPNELMRVANVNERREELAEESSGRDHTLHRTNQIDPKNLRLTNVLPPEQPPDEPLRSVDTNRQQGKSEELKAEQDIGIDEDPVLKSDNPTQEAFNIETVESLGSGMAELTAETEGDLEEVDQVLKEDRSKGEGTTETVESKVIEPSGNTGDWIEAIMIQGLNEGGSEGGETTADANLRVRRRTNNAESGNRNSKGLSKH
jgi:hypothetical protein